MYCPKIPMQKSWIPDKKKIIHIIEVHPYAELWKISWRIDKNTIANAENAQNIIPKNETNISGTDENDVSASIEYIASCQSVHFV